MVGFEDENPGSDRSINKYVPDNADVNVEGHHLSLVEKNGGMLGFSWSKLELDFTTLLRDFAEKKVVEATSNRQLFSTPHKTKPVADATERNQCGAVPCLLVLCSFFTKWLTGRF